MEPTIVFMSHIHVLRTYTFELLGLFVPRRQRKVKTLAGLRSRIRKVIIMRPANEADEGAPPHMVYAGSVFHLRAL